MQGDKQRLIIFAGEQAICKKRILIEKLLLFRTDKQIEKYLNLPVLSLFQIAVTFRK